MSANRLLVATRNAGKLREIRQILPQYEILGLDDLHIDQEIVEDGDTFEANAKIKASALSKLTRTPALADDSGLAVDALGGRPGVYSARYSGEGATDESNTGKLLAELASVPDGERTARYVCVMCLVRPDGETLFARGECEGVILRELRGENGFGYDPVFYLPEYQKTFAELPAEVKNRISHRAIALKKLSGALQNFL